MFCICSTKIAKTFRIVVVSVSSNISLLFNAAPIPPTTGSVT